MSTQSGRQRALSDPFWATAIGSMRPGPRGIVRELDAAFKRSPALAPYLWTGSGYRTGSKEHGSGCAIDDIITANTGVRPSAAERAAALLYLDWLVANHKILGIKGILFSRDGRNRTEVWGYSTPGKGWRQLADRGSISANHIDHIHLLFFENASWPSSLNGVVIGGPAKPIPPKPSNKTVAQMADEVIVGLHGNGHTNRQESLGVTAKVYEEVRAEVNKRTGNSAAGSGSPEAGWKSIEQMAQEVIEGLHGNGHTNRQESLGVTAKVYESVRKEVNRRVSGGSQPGRYRVTTNSMRLNGRSGPGTGYRVTMTAAKGYVLRIVETRNGWARSTGGHWYSMQYLTKA